MTDASVELSDALGRTSSILIERLRQKDQEAWGRFVHLYGPLVFHWCRRSGLQEADAADVGQEVFRKVAATIEAFHHDRAGDSFRGWLRTITRSRVIDFYRRQPRTTTGAGGEAGEAALRHVAIEDSGSDVSAEEDKDDALILQRRAVELVLESCREETRQAFLRVVVAGERPAEVAKQLGMTVNAVYVTKSHILRRIRDEFEGLVEA